MSQVDDDNTTIRQMREHITQLEQRANEAEAKAAKADQLERQMAIRDAGLELNAKQLRALEATHEGEWTPEAIKASAAELGIGAEVTPPPPTPAVPPEEMAAAQRLTNAATGAVQTNTSPDDDFTARSAALKADVAAGRVSAEKASEMFDEMYRSQYPERIAIH